MRAAQQHPELSGAPRPSSKLRQSESDPVRLRTLTGEWFCDVRAQRHQNLLGSDLVRASIRRRRRPWGREDGGGVGDGWGGGLMGGGWRGGGMEGGKDMGMGGGMDGWVGGGMDGGRIEGWVDGWMDEWMGGWRDG